MKKKESRKLRLSRETLQELTNPEIRKVLGAVASCQSGCVWCCAEHTEHSCPTE